MPVAGCAWKILPKPLLLCRHVTRMATLLFLGASCTLRGLLYTCLCMHCLLLCMLHYFQWARQGAWLIPWRQRATTPCGCLSIITPAAYHTFLLLPATTVCLLQPSPHPGAGKSRGVCLWAGERADCAAYLLACGAGANTMLRRMVPVQTSSFASTMVLSSGGGVTAGGSRHALHYFAVWHSVYLQASRKSAWAPATLW